MAPQQQQQQTPPAPQTPPPAPAFTPGTPAPASKTTTLSSKRSLVNKANSSIVTVTAIAAFVIVFSLVASKTLFGQAMYQNRIASAKKQTLSTLKSDITATKDLTSHYQAFDGSDSNIIGGTRTGTGSNDGGNSKVVLDALPSAYDFPALATSLEKIITNRGLTIDSITGTDDEVAQQSNQSSSAPQAVTIPFSLAVSGNYTSIKGFIDDLQNSIRPFQILTLTASGSEDSMNLSLTAQTYYQPEKDLNITTKVIK